MSLLFRRAAAGAIQGFWHFGVVTASYPMLRRVLWVCCFAMLGASGCCSYSVAGYQGPPSDHFVKGEFRNRWPAGERAHGFGDFWHWQLNRDIGLWDEWVPAPPGPAPPARVEGSALRVTFVGHSTLLVQTGGLNVLTDPVWSYRVGPTSWAGVARRRPPGIRFEDLPPIDVVLISHNHYDHMDLPTLRRLHAAHRPKVFVGLGNAGFLAEEGMPGATDMDWWDGVSLGPDVSLHAVPAQHFSRRGLCDGNETLWLGWVLMVHGQAIYFAGDTGYGSHFAEIGRRFAPVRFAMLPIGAYRPRWFMRAVHVDPAQAVRAHLELGAQTSVAMHFGTFRQADDGQYEPLTDLVEALEESALDLESFWVLGFGEGRLVPPIRTRAAMDEKAKGGGSLAATLPRHRDTDGVSRGKDAPR